MDEVWTTILIANIYNAFDKKEIAFIWIILAVVFALLKLFAV